jgi:hypothetical protein
MALEGAPLPLELLDSGDSAFVDAIRAVNDADALAAFAPIWYSDQRPNSRRLLPEYLARPLNAYRHEGLIKRLFKRAEAANDDELMARFLVLFDRSIRRVHRTRRRYHYLSFATEAEVRGMVSTWESLGYRDINVWARDSRFHMNSSTLDKVIVQPRGTTMPRGLMVKVRWYDGLPRGSLVPDWAILLNLDWEGSLEKADIRELPDALEKLKKYRLFSVITRNYLRRRAWRYFRRLGKTHPERYVGAVSQALGLYRDEDVADGLALIDNWGLVHILFHHCPAIEAKSGGWSITTDRSLAKLAPAPIFEPLWNEAPGAVVGLLSSARSRTVRRWAIRRIEADPIAHRSTLPLEGWIGLLGHDDPEVVTLAAGLLDGIEGLRSKGVDFWLALAEATHPDALEAVCELIRRQVQADQVTLEQAVRLAGLRSLPVARLGLSWVERKSATSNEDLMRFFSLVDAECEPLRPEILRILGQTLSAVGSIDPDFVLAFLDSRHPDARALGWSVFRSLPKIRDEVAVWKKLLESPYDDIKLALVAELESRASVDESSPDLRGLWASVLLNVHRGGRAKPIVVRQLLRRLESSPGEAPALLPLLGVALRSIRGPERRAGLVAVVQLVEKRAEVEPLVRSAFPELQWA